MLDRKWLIEHLDEAEAALKSRGEDPHKLQRILQLNDERREHIQAVEQRRSERKSASEEIGRRKRDGEDTSEAQERVRGIGQEISELEEKLQHTEQELDALLLGLPNLPHPDVPEGESETENRELRRCGESAEKTFDGARPHWEIGEMLGILELERAAKVSGARFAFMRGLGARLERVLVSWMMQQHADAGYEEIIPPYLVRREALIGTGQLPKFSEDLFQIDDPELYLIPTAEVPVTNLFAEEIMAGDELPQRFVAFSPCFRAEAGAAGQDTRGIIRVHQFHKVELVRFERPEESDAALEELTGHAESILKALELPYRVISLCTGDLGFGAAKTYDLEVWLPGQQRWLEVSSCSTFTDFQARRANIRYRPEPEAKPQFVHTLNGSGLAVGRTIVAIFENYQQKDGTVKVPEALSDAMKVATIG